MKRQRTPLLDRVLEFVRRHNLLAAGDRVVVAVSGGPDSVCMLHILNDLHVELGIDLQVAHLDHMLRGAESDADLVYVEGLARKLGLPATVERVDVEAYRRQHRLSVEEAAREARYGFLTSVAQGLTYSKIAAGHTADDQVETILMHLIRGAGLHGLRGMQPACELRSGEGGPGLTLVRPLLAVARAETESYCAEHGLSPRMDQSNSALVYQRNSIRLDLLPLLRSYNPEIETALLRTASTVSIDMEFLELAASALWGSVMTETDAGIVINRAAFDQLHPALKRHIVRLSIRHLLGDLKDVEALHIEAVVDGMAESTGKRLSLPRGLEFRSGYEGGVIARGGEQNCPYPPIHGEHRLNVPGSTRVGDWTIEATVLDNKIKLHEPPPTTAYLDLDMAGNELTVRTWRRGDRFQPLGMEGTKKLHDFFVDEKVPRDWRAHIPLVCSAGQVVWVVGYRIGEAACLTAATSRILRLDFVKP